LDVIQSAGERSPEDAKQYLENLKEEGRYVTDVY
jgi:sulfite reductase alpha subunit-like flavoprotein